MSKEKTIALVSLVLFVMALIFAAGCGDAENKNATGSDTTAPQAFTDDVQQKLGKVLDDQMAANNLPGAIVGIWVPGKGEWVIARGLADTASGRAMQVNDKVRIASNTKTFTATVILQLVDEGRLSLDDKLEQYISGIPNGEQITIRQVLNMTAGIYSFTHDDEFNVRFNSDPLWKFTHAEMLAIIQAHGADFAPGADWSYSDSNYELLGMIIEQVTGNNIEDEVQTRLLDPLEMKNTTFPTTPDMDEPFARGYTMLPGSQQLSDYTRVDPSTPWAAGAIVSDLQDMRTWARALGRGDLISDEMQKERETWVAMPGQENIDGKYGLGLFSFGGYVGHIGAIFGFNSVIFYLPSEDAVFVMVTNNSANDSQAITKVFIQMAKIVYPETFPNIPAP